MRQLYFVFMTLLVLSIFQFAHASAPAEGGHGAPAGHTLKLLYNQPEVDLSAVKAPAKMVLKPESRAKIPAASVLTWEADANADAYHIQVASDPNFKWPIFDDRLYKGTSLDLAAQKVSEKLEAGKHYFWRVAGIKTTNDAGYLKGPYAVSTFTVSQ